LIYPGEQLQLPADTTVASPEVGVDIDPDSVPRADNSDQKPRLPATPTPQNPVPHTSPPHDPLPSGTPATPSTTHVPDTSPPSAPSRASGDSGFRFGEELFVGVGLAAAVSAAFAVARRRQRSRYRPGSGDRADLAIAPAVYQLRLAHLRAEQHHGGVDGDLVQTPQGSGTPMVLGVRDGREITLDLATVHGLGLIGAGAAAAVRALVVSALTATPQPEPHKAKVIVTAADLTALCGSSLRDSRDRRARPTLLQVAANLDAALDELESVILVRAGAPQSPPGGWAPVLLVTSAPQRGLQRLQAILDNGAAVGVTGLVLGQWPAGVTAYVRDNGTISTTTRGGAHLRGTRVFHMTADDAADLLSLLHDADPHHRDHQSDQHAPVKPEGQATANYHLEIVHADNTSGPERDLRPATLRPPPNVSAATAGPERFAGPQDTVNDPPGLLRISVLGPVRMWWRDARTAPDPANTATTDHEVTSAFQPRVRELLVFLALHPDGASREALISALWAASPPERTTNAMNTSISRLRRALAAATGNVLSDLVVVGEGRYRLDPELVEVDYHHFAAAVTARRAAVTDADRVEAYRRIVDNYTGPLADGLSTDWIETAREAIRRDAIDAVAALARTLVEDDPQQTLDLLEIARAFDPHNELIYRDIMRLQERLGQLDAIPRTLTLLTTRLAEVDDRPTHQAVDLADRLRRRHDAPGEPGRADRGHSRAG
jgi:DNA-binding SARP family transcriptional activator